MQLLHPALKSPGNCLLDMIQVDTYMMKVLLKGTEFGRLQGDEIIEFLELVVHPGFQRINVGIEFSRQFLLEAFAAFLHL